MTEKRTRALSELLSILADKIDDGHRTFDGHANELRSMAWYLKNEGKLPQYYDKPISDMGCLIDSALRRVLEDE